MQLHNKIAIGLVAGIGVGAMANLGDIGWLQTALVSLEPVGTAFIRLITMIVIPLVVASILLGASSLGDLRTLGRIGGKTIVYYAFTTAQAVVIGLLMANLIKPGGHVDPSTRQQLAAEYSSQASSKVKLASELPSVSDILLNIIPRNPVRSAADFDLLPLIFFAIIFGAAVSLVKKEPRTAVIRFFEGINEASMIIIRWIMKLAPYAVFALISVVVARFGVDLLKSLLLYCFVVILALLLHLFGTISVLVRLAAKMSPVTFFRRVAAVPIFAFSTSSSNASLPLSIEVAEEKLGISNRVSSFVLPLGATVNMNGTAVYQAVSVMFIAQIFGVPLDLAAQLTIVLTATLASVGTAGVPGGGVITLIIVLQSVGMGAEIEAGIPLILGVERILDMSRTAVNVTGDLSCAAYIGRSEGEMSLEDSPSRPAPATEAGDNTAR